MSDTKAIGELLLAMLAPACGPQRTAGDDVVIRFWAMGREGEVVEALVRESRAGGRAQQRSARG